MQRLFYGLGFVLIGALFYVYVKYDPGLFQLFPKCPFHALTGFDCPGCGSQRAVHALLNGAFLSAMDYNIMLVASLPLLAFHFSVELYSRITGKRKQLNFLYYPSTPLFVGVLVIVFWVIRNIPFYPFTYLRA